MPDISLTRADIRASKSSWNSTSANPPIQRVLKKIYIVHNCAAMDWHPMILKPNLLWRAIGTSSKSSGKHSSEKNAVTAACFDVLNKSLGYHSSWFVFRIYVALHKCGKYVASLKVNVNRSTITAKRVSLPVNAVLNGYSKCYPCQPTLLVSIFS